MNREAIIDQIIEAYMNGIYLCDPDTWIENVLRNGREDKPFNKMTDEELMAAHRVWCEWAYEEGEMQ